MLKKLFNQFRFDQKGFTLIELLVVIAILGVLAAIAIPNLTQSIGSSKTAAKAAEFTEVQNCVAAAMSDPPVTPTLAPAEFGNTGETVPPTGTDLAIGSKQLSSYIVGGVKTLGHYSVDAYGNVQQLWYP